MGSSTYPSYASKNSTPDPPRTLPRKRMLPDQNASNSGFSYDQDGEESDMAVVNRGMRKLTGRGSKPAPMNSGTSLNTGESSFRRLLPRRPEA